MKEIRTLLKIAATRLELSSLLGAVSAVAVVAATLALVLAVADRLPAESFLAWRWVGPALVAGCGLVAVALWWRRRLSALDVAVHVDERLGLRERMSTALHCDGRSDAFARAAVEDAVATATDPRTREAVRRRYAVGAPKNWWIAPLLAFATTGVLFLPQADLFAGEDAEEQAAISRAQSEVEEAFEVIAKTVEDKPQLSAELGDLVQELNAPARDADALRDPEHVKRDALKKVTDLNKRLDEILSGEKGKTADALENMLAKMKTPPDGAGKELAEALASGDFKTAQEALEKMIEDMKNGDLSAEQKAELAKQLEEIAKQLEQLAQKQDELKQALQQAGLDPQLANNPQALQQALEQAANLNDQQKQQLQQMMQAQQAAQQMMKGLGQGLAQMAQQMMQGEPGQLGQQAQGQLTQMEQLQALLEQAQAAQSQCKGEGLGQGMTMSKALEQWKTGPGMGNWGAGAGGKAPVRRTPSGTRMAKADAPLGDGEIIASMLIDGTPVRGESKAKLRQVIDASAEGYDEALNEDLLPRQYHDAMKHYFGQLQQLSKAVTADVGEDPAPAEPAPAETDGASGGSDGK